VKVIEAQSVRGDAIERWRWYRAAERACSAEARVVCHGQQNVRGLLRSGDRLGEVWLGLLGLAADDTVETLVRNRKHLRAARGRFV
jgi:hypothetical protein